MSGRRSALLALLLAMVAITAQLGALGHDLVWDDVGLRAWVAEQARHGGALAVARAEFRLDPAFATGYYRPVVLFTLWLEQQLAPGQAARLHHLSNLLVHGAVTALVFALARLLGATATSAFLATLVFAVHPVHVESVAFVAGRTDLWAALFTLGSTLLWLRVRQRLARSATRERAASALLWLLATLAKEVAFLLPAVLLAWDLALEPARPDSAGRDPGATGARARWWQRNSRWLLAWAIALAASFGLRLGLAGVGLGGVEVGAAAAGAASPARPALVGLTALRMLLLPWPLRPWYEPAELAPGLPGLLAAAALLVLLVLATSRTASRAGWLALAWLAAFLLPALGLVPRGGAVFAERFLYLPSISLAVLALAAGALAGRARRGVAALLLLLVAAFTATTIAGTRTWRDELTLFSTMALRSPTSATARNGLGLALDRSGQLDAALAAFEQAVRLDPTLAEAHNNLGTMRRARGELAMAIDSFRTAVALLPDWPSARSNLGEALLAASQPVAAEAELRRAVALAPAMPEALNNLGLLLQRQGRPDEAAEAHRRALAADPSDARAWTALGDARSGLGQHDAAAEAYEQAIARDPSAARARAGLVLAHARAGRRAHAARELGILGQIDPALAAAVARSLPGTP